MHSAGACAHRHRGRQMNTQWIIYRDIADFPRKVLERMPRPKPGDKVIKDQVFPAMYGYPAIYIKNHELMIDEIAVHLITYTEAKVLSEQAEALARQAIGEAKQ